MLVSKGVLVKLSVERILNNNLVSPSTTYGTSKTRRTLPMDLLVKFSMLRTIERLYLFINEVVTEN